MNKNIESKNYNSVAASYEFLSNLYSLGKIKYIKRTQVEEMKVGDKVLYVGVGTGDDAILAAQKNCDITCIDLSESMINLTKEKFKNSNETAEFICGNVLEHDRIGYYDVITANFFLNIFKKEDMKKVLADLVKFLKPGGKLLIADFSLPTGNYFYKAFQFVYHAIGNGSYYIQKLAPFHSVYDYRKYLDDSGLEYISNRTAKLFNVGPISYESIVTVRVLSQKN